MDPLEMRPRVSIKVIMLMNDPSIQAEEELGIMESNHDGKDLNNSSTESWCQVLLPSNLIHP